MLAPELSIPALFVAGLASAPHCGLMCGPLQGWFLNTRGALPVRVSLLWLHAGRLLGYAALGAIAGAAGGALLRLFPSPVLGQAVRIFAAATLVIVALRQLRKPAANTCNARHHTRLPMLSPPLRLLAQGWAWSWLPCGLLYSALLLAGFSGGAGSGAVLLLAFGLGTVPVLAAAGGITAGLRPQPARLKRAATALLVVFGLASAFAVLAHPSWLPDAWCAPGIVSGHH